MHKDKEDNEENEMKEECVIEYPSETTVVISRLMTQYIYISISISTIKSLRYSKGRNMIGKKK